VVVLAAANEDADGGGAGLAAEFVIHQCDVEVQFAGELGLELPGLELDDEIAQLLDVEEQQVRIIPSWE
jgi:hypothetical protein